MSSQLWLRMAGYIYYISSRYVFISSFVLPTTYAGQKLNNLMWLRMAGEGFYIFYSYVFGLYTVLLTSMTAKHNHRYHKNNRFCLFITFK